MTTMNARRYTRSDYDLFDILGTRLHQARTAAAYSQTRLAKQIRTSPNTISLLESGQRPEVSAMLIRRLAVALGVSTDYLLGLSDTAP